MELFDSLKPKGEQSLYGGGDGGSIETAVVINTTSTSTGVAAEYDYVVSNHGQRSVGWDMEFQELRYHNSRHYDVLNIKLSNGESKSYYFDITQFYGRDAAKMVAELEAKMELEEKMKGTSIKVARRKQAGSSPKVKN